MESATGQDLTDEIHEAQITSNDPSERKLARRLRIQKRLEVARKQQVVIEEEVFEETEKSLPEQQVENSTEQLEKLRLEGRELVTNVRVANDSREVKRREEEGRAREKRIEAIEEEARKSIEKFEEIDQKWAAIADSNDPLDIHHALGEQKAKCKELISQKDALIEDLRKELEFADIRFQKDQQKQQEDIDLLADRIDNQVNVMRRAYRQELKLIEQAIDTERKQLLEANRRRWDSLYNEREKEEVANMEKKFQQVAEYEEAMRKIDIEHQENYRESKIKLETDIQVLQQELEKVKASCLLNSEKLDYNYQVLKERDDENLIMKSQQKRQINKLQDVVNSLKRSIAETESTTKLEATRLREEIIRLHEKLIDIEKRTNYFSEVNDTKYHQLWDMNRETASKLLHKILEADRVIQEQQLGLAYTPPDLKVLKKKDLKSYQSAKQVVEKLFLENDDDKPDNVEELTKTGEKRSQATDRLLKQILKKVADNTGFLIEERLHRLLFIRRDKEKTLVKIDNVFSALGISTEEDILMMKDFFLPYAVCTICGDSKVTLQDEEEEETRLPELTKSESACSELSADTTAQAADSSHSNAQWEDHSSDTSSASLLSSMQLDEANHTQAHQEAASIAEETIMKATDSTADKEKRIECQLSHPLAIDPVYVLKALREFASEFSKKKQSTFVNMASRLSRKRTTVSRLITEDDVTAYWNSFEDTFPTQAIKLWDCLFVGMQKYHNILKERHQLNEETTYLQQQNSELRRLLQGYMLSSGNGSTSPVNKNTLPSLI